MSSLNLIIITAILFLVSAIVLRITMKMRQERAEKKKRAQERAYREAIERARQREIKERVFKAETGHIPTMLYLAKEAERTSAAEALHWYEKAAMLGSTVAMQGVVRLCERVPNDLLYQAKGRFWKNAIDAEEGNIGAKYEKAIALMEGRGTDQDIISAVEIMEEIAESGYEKAELFLGDWYQSSKNASPDLIKSGLYYYRASLRANTAAMIKLGDHYERGRGVCQSLYRASYWFEVAAEMGDVNAQYRAGILWANRSAQGNSIAYIWLFLSASNGHEEAAKKRDQVATTLGVDTIVGLQGLTKPLFKKLKMGRVAKHSIIKALNKLYQRVPYFPDEHGCEFSELMEQSDHFQTNSVAENTTVTDNTTVAENTKAEEASVSDTPASTDYSVNMSYKSAGNSQQQSN